MSRRSCEPLMDARFEVEGCHLIDHVTAEELIGDHHVTYHSRAARTGPHAWDDHWLFVLLWSRTGEVIGVIWVDDPSDRLLPSERKLQALRVFANQATTALDAAAQYEEMQFLAEHDPLTRLFNRRAFDARLERRWRGPCATSHPLALRSVRPQRVQGAQRRPRPRRRRCWRWSESGRRCRPPSARSIPRFGSAATSLPLLLPQTDRPRRWR